MKDLSEILAGVITIAIITVVVSTDKAPQAISQLGDVFAASIKATLGK